jgi:stage V sporulation protein AA
VGFCIGLAAGIMIFYNHIGQKKITDDPTPIQVAMRKYEQDIDTTYIEASGREGSSIDVDS